MYIIIYFYSLSLFDLLLPAIAYSVISRFPGGGEKIKLEEYNDSVSGDVK